MTPTPVLELPSLAGTIDYLRSFQNPILNLGLVLEIEGGSDRLIDQLRQRVAEMPLVAQAFSSQRSDGSWGEHDQPLRRVFPTLWMAKALTELGIDSTHASWNAAAEFLMATAHTDGGVFSISGRRDGVLSCYVGIAGVMYQLGGRPDLAEPQVNWILGYQDVRHNGRQLRRDPIGEWHGHLRTKYGGCMANTTCLVGLVRTGRALQGWASAKPGVIELVQSIRDVFLDRKVMYRSNGSVAPLSVVPARAESWLAPAFPLDWRIDLIEVLDFLARSGPPDCRMQDAVDRLVSFRLPDGTWPLARTYRPEHLPLIERRSNRKGSPIITLRAATALHALGAAI